MQNQGFTLIEVICTLIIMGFIGLMVGTFLIQGVEGYVFTQQNNTQYQAISMAMNRLAMEFKSMTRILSRPKPNAIQYERGDQIFSLKKIGGKSPYTVKLIDSAKMPSNKTGCTLIDQIDDFILEFKQSDGKTNWIWSKNNLEGLYLVRIRIDVTVNGIPKSFTTAVNPLYNNTRNGPDA